MFEINLPVIAIRPALLSLKCEKKKKNGQDFRTGPYFIMHTLLCFKKTIGFFSKSIWTEKKPVELLSEIRKIEQFFLQFRHFSVLE